MTARTIAREKLGRWGGTGDGPLKTQGMRQGKGRLSGKGGEPQNGGMETREEIVG